jgi:hypothetical protein
MNKMVLILAMAANGLFSGLASAEEIAQASLEVENRTRI